MYIVFTAPESISKYWLWFLWLYPYPCCQIEQDAINRGKHRNVPEMGDISWIKGHSKYAKGQNWWCVHREHTWRKPRLKWLRNVHVGLLLSNINGDKSENSAFMCEQNSHFLLLCAELTDSPFRRGQRHPVGRLGFLEWMLPYLRRRRFILPQTMP